jgi:uncharacterized protein (DUF58 family)
MVDVSASGNFGSASQSKREMAAELASVLASSAIRNNDKVGLILFSDQIEQYIPPRKGRRHVLRVIREILFFHPQHVGTDLVKALNFANQVIARRAVAFLISDFLAPDFRKAIQLTHRRHDLVAITITDPRERELPSLGLITIEDSETGEQFEIHTQDPKVRTLFATQAKQREESLRKSLRSSGVDTLALTTGESYMPALRQFFETRQRRR